MSTGVGIPRGLFQMKQNIVRSIACALVMSGLAYATPITPTYDSFGPLPAATFGGSGIPNDAVAISTYTSGGLTITLALTATERYSNPPVSDDGAGTFTALAGSDGGLAMWNFDYYINVTGGSYSDYNFQILYDFAPAAGTDSSQLGSLNAPGSFIAANVVPSQDSVNLGFASLDTLNAPYVLPPVYPSFSPTAIGEYSFVLGVYTTSGALIDMVAINVNTVPVPEPATLTVIGLGLGSVALSRWWKRRV